jgi:hypothetical protein
MCEMIIVLKDSKLTIADTIEFFYSIEHAVMHRGWESKSNEKGDARGAKDAIENGVGQVLTGINGLVQAIAEKKYLAGEHGNRVLFPVIFTTARLWVADADLSNADILKGEIGQSDVHWNNVPYLFYQYHLSRGIKHSLKRFAVTDESLIGGLSYSLLSEFIRTVAIVSASGIETFLKEFTPNTVTLQTLQQQKIV